MTTHPHVTRARPSLGTRRFGYVVSIAINLALLFMVNRSPGWQSVGFLTDRTPEVLGLVNLSLTATVVANAIYSTADPDWLRALGDAVTTAIGLASLVRIWQVFPFEFDTSSVPWDLVARWVIGIGIFGCGVAIIVAVVRLVRALIRT
jgi:hypothetical protein